MNEVRDRAGELRQGRRAFVSATVVRAERPTSARPGDAALVLDDGTIIGFVGGECAEASVQVQALAALRTGEPVLLRISPDGPAASSPGVVTVHNPCLSGGTLEIFLEPVLPPPLVVVHGDAPIARAVRGLAAQLGYAVEGFASDVVPGATAVVVASHGRGEADVLVAAARAGVPYIGLVASPKRGTAVLAALDLTAEERALVRSPAGLDIGARTPEEVALSILTEIVASRPRVAATPEPVSAPVAPATAVDPVCGMTVAMVEGGLHAEVDGTTWWFCGSGCRQAFVADPSGFLRA